MNMVQQINKLESRFAQAQIDNGRRVAEEVVAHLLDCSPLAIYQQSFPENKEVELDQMVKRIEAHEPLQYVVGTVDFRGLEIHCDSRALIPRPETEALVEEILQAPIWKNTPRIADIGTGSGCIILTLANEHPNAHFFAVDLSPDALELAKENAQRLQLDQKINWKCSSLLDDFAPESLDLVVANLPYISTADWEMLDPSVLQFEPRTALDSGPSGMELIEILLQQATRVLVPNGMIFLEFGYDQGSAVQHALEKNGYQNICIKTDLAGHPRIAIANVKGNKKMGAPIC